MSAPDTCAFCEAPAPTWGYPSQTFTVAPTSAPDHPPLDFGGITWACQRCASYITRHR